MVGSRHKTVSALSQQHSCPVLEPCSGQGRSLRVLMTSQGHALVLGAGTIKDFRMSEAVRRKGQKNAVLSLAVSRKDVWLC